MLLIVLVVLFVMAVAFWCASLWQGNAQAAGWAAWSAVLILGITVFLIGSGVVTWTTH